MHSVGGQLVAGYRYHECIRMLRVERERLQAGSTAVLELTFRYAPPSCTCTLLDLCLPNNTCTCMRHCRSEQLISASFNLIYFCLLRESAHDGTT